MQAEQSRRSMALRAANLRGFRSFGEVDSALSGAIRDAALRRFLLKSLERDGSRGFRWRISVDEIVQNYDDLTEAVVVEKPLAKPACFVRGGISDFVHEDDLVLIREAFPRAEIRTIASAGHWVHMDAADEFFTIVTDFLAAAHESHS